MHRASAILAQMSSHLLNNKHSAHFATFQMNQPCVSLLLPSHRAPKLTPLMPWKRKATGGLLALVGYMLSPLSWWNDLFVNVPLAYAFASVIALFYEPAFEPSLVLGYWITNILGFVLMQKGGERILCDTNRKYRLRYLLRDVGISLAYTALIVVLVKLGILKPIGTYFRKP